MKDMVKVRDLITGKSVNKERMYTTDEHGFLYYICETDAGETAMRIPRPHRNIYQTSKASGGYATQSVVLECLEDYGLCELDREYINDGTTMIYGF